ncbi:Uncharacterised protein [Serratia liquefaciens]|nr:Uncharacterised protein [Serratia liquefaciens]
MALLNGNACRFRQTIDVIFKGFCSLALTNQSRGLTRRLTQKLA